jgi:hypothetical protein
MTRSKQAVLFLEKEGLALLSMGQPPGRLVLHAAEFCVWLGPWGDDDYVLIRVSKQFFFEKKNQKKF